MKQFKHKEFVNIFERSPSEIVGRTVEGFMVTIKAEPEEMNAADYWWKETDCFKSKKAAKRFAEKSDNPFWFCSVSVEIVDTLPVPWKEHTEYLGCCNYESGGAFIKDGYFDDMLSECLKQIRA